MKKLLLFFLSLPLCAQTYTATKTTSLTSSTEVITVQQPSSSSRHVQFISATVDCKNTTSLTFTLERNGTDASSTTLAIAKQNSSDSTPTVSAWSGSNVGTSTVLGTYICPATGTGTFGGRVLDLTQQVFDGVGPGKNLTIRTASDTGTVYITILWKEI